MEVALLENEERLVCRLVDDFRFGFNSDPRKIRRLMREYNVSSYDFERVREVLLARLKSLRLDQIQDPCFWLEAALVQDDVKFSESERAEIQGVLDEHDDVVRYSRAAIVFNRYKIRALRRDAISLSNSQKKSGCLGIVLILLSLSAILIAVGLA